MSILQKYHRITCFGSLRREQSHKPSFPVSSPSYSPRRARNARLLPESSGRPQSRDLPFPKSRPPAQRRPSRRAPSRLARPTGGAGRPWPRAMCRRPLPGRARAPHGAARVPARTQAAVRRASARPPGGAATTAAEVTARLRRAAPRPPPPDRARRAPRPRQRGRGRARPLPRAARMGRGRGGGRGSGSPGRRCPHAAPGLTGNNRPQHAAAAMSPASSPSPATWRRRGPAAAAAPIS